MLPLACVLYHLREHILGWYAGSLVHILGCNVWLLFLYLNSYNLCNYDMTCSIYLESRSHCTNEVPQIKAADVIYLLSFLLT